MGPDYTEVLKQCGGMDEYLNFVREEYTRGTLIEDILAARSQSPGHKVIVALLKDRRLTKLLLQSVDSQSFERACQYIVDSLSRLNPIGALAQSLANDGEKLLDPHPLGLNNREFVKKYGGPEGYLKYVREVVPRASLIKDMIRDGSSQFPEPGVIIALVNDRRLTELLQAANPQSFERACQYIIDFLSKLKPTDASALSSQGESVLAGPRDINRRGQEHIPGLRAGFRRPYIGNAVDYLYEYLTDCDTKFDAGDPKYYARFCSVVQSSGTGKTRTLIELMKTRVLGVYINVRLAEEMHTYPLRDDVPANILTPLSTTLEDYKDRYYAFFTALFTVLRRRLHEMGAASMSPEDLIAAWSAVMCANLESTHRSEFFRDVDSEYQTLRYRARTRLADERQHPSKTQDTIAAQVEGLTKEAGGLNFEDRGGDPSATNKIAPIHMSSTSNQWKSRDQALRDAYKTLVTEFPTFFVQGSHHPRLVIAIDEVYHLYDERNGFRPLDILCQVINHFSIQQRVSNWVVFASTTSRIADVSTLQARFPIRIGQELFPPYSLCDWDQMAKPFGEVDPWNVSHFSNLVGFGRPLWRSLTEFLTATSIMETARDKLCGAPSFNPHDPSHVLAVVGQRICLDVRFGDPKSVGLQVDSVAKHLRVCLGTTDNRLWQTTRYPSEPLLSCAASQILYPMGDDGSTLATALERLVKMVTSGMTEMGQKDELTSRILYLIGKDLFVRTLSFPSLPQELKDCQPMPVIGYLRFLFGEINLQHATMDNHTQTLESLFSNWYINFSHWISMSGPISFPESDAKSQANSLTEWLARHWFRTCAVRCSRGQQLIDKLIPMFKLEPKQQSTATTASCDGQVSFILISDRASRESAGAYLDTITPTNLKIPEIGQPYIVIRTDLGSKQPKLEFDLIQDHSATPSLRVYAAGIDAKTYRFLEPNDMRRTREVLQQMVAVSRNPRNILPLRARLEYGVTTDGHHMKWELRERVLREGGITSCI